MYRGIFPQGGEIATCILVFDQSEVPSRAHSGENMRCLGGYKGVILLLGTSSSTEAISFLPFSATAKSLYLIPYSGSVTASNRSDSPFIFIWKTHLVLDRTAEDESREPGMV